MRNLFPFFNKSIQPSNLSTPPVYLDNAATTQKLESVIERTCDFYTNAYATVNRASYPLANEASKAYEHIRQLTANLINARKNSEVIFTSGATQSINLVANGLQAEHLNGNKLVVLASEHHANLLPWQQLCKRLGLNLHVINLAENGQWTNAQEHTLMAAIDEDTAIVAIAHVSNLLGNIYPVSIVCKKAKQVNAISLIDGTQAIAHLRVDVQSIDCDCYVFSSHKMYGPTGLGVLYCRTNLAERLNPSNFGGEMITDASFDSFDLQPAPLKFETGTGNIAAVIGFEPAVLFVKNNINKIKAHEYSLYRYALEKISEIAGIKVLGNNELSIGIISFYPENNDTFDIANALYQQNIAVRAGSHCAIPMLKSLGIENCIRMSIGCYNSFSDIDAFIFALKKAMRLQPEMSSFEQVHKEITTDLPLAKKIAAAKTWDNKYRQLLFASKVLETIESELCKPQSEVLGCETKVWIVRENQRFKAHTKSKIIKGILALLFEKANELDSENLASFDFNEYLYSLGLVKYFSEGRKDGINNAILRIKELA